MNVRVDEEADRAGIDAPDCGQHLVADLQILRVDHEDPVWPREHADASAGAVRMSRIDAFRSRQHVEIRRELVGLDLDLVVLNRALRGGARGPAHGDQQREEEVSRSRHRSRSFSSTDRSAELLPRLRRKTTNYTAERGPRPIDTSAAVA